MEKENIHLGMEAIMRVNGRIIRYQALDLFILAMVKYNTQGNGETMSLMVGEPIILALIKMRHGKNMKDNSKMELKRVGARWSLRMGQCMMDNSKGGRFVERGAR